MSDIPARIKDLTERISSIKDELNKMADEFSSNQEREFFGDEYGLTKRLGELQDELKELQPQSTSASVDTSIDYPEISVPDPNATGLGQGVHDFDTWPTTGPVDGDYLEASAKEPMGERYGTTDAKPSDPMNDPEIKAIDRRYNETISKLDQENRKFEEGKGVEEAKDVEDLTTVPTQSTTDAKPEPISDPFNDPEIRAIDRRYRETIAKLDEENAKHNNTKKVLYAVGVVIVVGIAYFALRSNDEAMSPVPVTVADTVADTVPETVPPVTVAEVVLPQAATAAQAGYSCVGEQFQLFESSNIYLVSGGGGTPPTFSTGGKPYCLTSVSTYHWNDGNGAAPGKVGLRGTQEMVGPAQAQGTSGQGGAQNVNWVYVPASDALPLLNGQYTCTDSDSATWSQNKESGGQGFCRIWVQTAQK